MEHALYEIESMRLLAGLGLSRDGIPDEPTILKIRRFLEKQGLTAKMLDAVNEYLSGKGLLRQGMIMNARSPGAVVDEELRTSTEMAKLLHGREKTVCADAGYQGAEKRVPKGGRRWYIAAKRGSI